MARNILKKMMGATASVPAEDGSHEHDDLAAELAKLEAVVDTDPACAAAKRLESFSLTPGAKSLCDRALDSMSTNTGANLPAELEDLKRATQARAALVEAAGGDLSIIIDAIVGSCGNPKDIGPAVNSLCFSVLKSASFFANLDYRRFLDPRGDFDLSTYTGVSSRGENGDEERSPLDFARDRREEEPSAPVGLDTVVNREREFFGATYGDDPGHEASHQRALYDTGDPVPDALEELRIFLTLTSEAFGWDMQGELMPFAFLREKDETYTPIRDVYLALDFYEIKRKESAARRSAQQAVQMLNAADKAREIVKAALRR